MMDDPIPSLEFAYVPGHFYDDNAEDKWFPCVVARIYIDYVENEPNPPLVADVVAIDPESRMTFTHTLTVPFSMLVDAQQWRLDQHVSDGGLAYDLAGDEFKKIIGKTRFLSTSNRDGVPTEVMYR